MTLTFQLYYAARDCLTSLMERLTPRELYYIGGPDPLPAPLTPEEEQARTCSSLCCAPSVSGLCSAFSFPAGQRFSHRSHEMHRAASTAG